MSPEPVSTDPPHPGDGGDLDVTSAAFARRLGNLLVDRRSRERCSVRAMARRSGRRFDRHQLRRYEAGTEPLDIVTVSALAALYRVDVAAIAPERTGIDIVDDDWGGTIVAAGVSATFAGDDPDALLETYLRLVRRLRDAESAEVVSLRREDVERLAAHLGTSGETVVQRLGALMGATRVQRRMMAGMFMAGAMVVTVAVPSVAALTIDGSPGGSNGSPEAPVTVATVADPGTAPAAVPGADGDGVSPGSPGSFAADAARTTVEPTSPIPATTAAPTPPPTTPPAETPAEPVATTPPPADQGPATTQPDPAPPATEPPGAQPPGAQPPATTVPAEPAPPSPAPPAEPELAPAPAPPGDEVVETGPPPVPVEPAPVVDPPPPAPTPAPPSSSPPPAPEPPPEPESGQGDDGETVAVAPPPVPAPDPGVIVDPPG